MPLSATASGGGSQYKSNSISSSFLNKILPQTSIFHNESLIYNNHKNLPIDNLSTSSVPWTVSNSCVVFWVERVHLHILKLFKYVFHGMNNLEFIKFLWNGAVQSRLYSIYLAYSFFFTSPSLAGGFICCTSTSCTSPGFILAMSVANLSWT